MKGKAADSFKRVKRAVPVVVHVPPPARPDREGKKALHVFLPKSMHKHLHMVALELDTSATALVAEAITDLFAKKRLT